MAKSFLMMENNMKIILVDSKYYSTRKIPISHTSTSNICHADEC